jgi:hypothetical protein
VPIEIRRFGSVIGGRTVRLSSVGLAGRSSIRMDARNLRAGIRAQRLIEPHASPNTTYFIVVEGGGWVGVGDEWTRIARARRPSGRPTSARGLTEHSEMCPDRGAGGADDRDTVTGRARDAGRDDLPVGVEAHGQLRQDRPTARPGHGRGRAGLTVKPRL